MIKLRETDRALLQFEAEGCGVAEKKREKTKKKCVQLVFKYPENCLSYPNPKP